MRLGELGDSMDTTPAMAVGAFMLSMLAGLPDPRCAQCVREQGPLTIVGGQMDDVATTGRGWTKHNSCGFGTISTHLPTTPPDLACARVATLHLPSRGGHAHIPTTRARASSPTPLAFNRSRHRSNVLPKRYDGISVKYSTIEIDILQASASTLHTAHRSSSSNLFPS